MTWKRRYWIGIVLLLLAALVVVIEAPVDAAPATAPRYQTVPLPTPTSEPAPLPTATPQSNDSDDDDNGDDGGGSPPPVEPESPPEEPAAEPDGGAAVPVSESIDEIIGTVVVTKLNIRQEPNIGSDIVGVLTAGDQVTLLGRNEAGDWWIVCCVGDEGVPGWASAQFMRPNIRRIDVNGALPVIASLADVGSATPEIDDGEFSDGEIERTSLLLTIEQRPPFVVQGEQMVLQLTVVNNGGVEAQGVILTDQLPTQLLLESATASTDGVVRQETGDGDAVVVRVEWPSLDPGETAAVELNLTADLPNGTVIDNLATGEADNADSISNGISIGAAPVDLPIF